MAIQESRGARRPVADGPQPDSPTATRCNAVRGAVEFSGLMILLSRSSVREELNVISMFAYRKSDPVPEKLVRLLAIHRTHETALGIPHLAHVQRPAPGVCRHRGIDHHLRDSSRPPRPPLYP